MPYRSLARAIRPLLTLRLSDLRCHRPEYATGVSGFAALVRAATPLQQPGNPVAPCPLPVLAPPLTLAAPSGPVHPPRAASPVEPVRPPHDGPRAAGPGRNAHPAGHRTQRTRPH